MIGHHVAALPFWFSSFLIVVVWSQISACGSVTSLTTNNVLCCYCLRVTVIGVFNPKRKKFCQNTRPLRITVTTLGRGDRRETAGRLRGGRVRGIGGMADDESFFVSADEADDDGRRAPGPVSYTHLTLPTIYSV